MASLKHGNGETEMTSNHAAAARQIRQELKKHNIKATVRASSYSGGSSIQVTILQDVLPATKEAIKTFANKYQYGHFDGMTDCYEYSQVDKDLPQVSFVFVDVEYSDEIKAAVAEYIDSIKGIEGNLDQYRHMTLNGSWGDFWNGRKPTIRLAA